MPYVSSYLQERTSPMQYAEIDGIESVYRDVLLRDKVVYRIDTIHAIKDVYLGESITGTYRDLAYQLISGNITDQKIVIDVIKVFYTQDLFFRRFVGEIYHFDEAYNNNSLYSLILCKIRDYITEYKKSIIALECGRYLLESHGFLYFSVDDDETVKISIPSNTKLEVLSKCRKLDVSNLTTQNAY